MADNTKIERIPLSKISVEQKFDGDLYWDGFLLHPASIALSKEDLNVFQNWKIAEFELRNRQNQDTFKDPLVKAAILEGSAQIIEQDAPAMKEAQRLHTEICGFVQHCHQTVINQKPFPAEQPIQKLKQYIESIRSMGASILRLGELESNAGYIEVHSANSLILAVMLGNFARLPQHRLLNLALAALFHEVGLNPFLPIMEQKGPLSSREFELQKQHVESAQKLLRPYNLPTEVLETILHHHEHLDGSGYPHGSSQNEISELGCYLGLVCSYVGMTCARKFQSPRLPHVAMTNLLREAKTFYNFQLVRFLLLMLSLYPVGSGVCLSNGTIGKVLRANPKDPRLPVVQILLDAQHGFLEQSIIVQTNEKLQIERPVPYKMLIQC